MKKVIEMFPEFHQEKLETTDIKEMQTHTLNKLNLH